MRNRHTLVLIALVALLALLIGEQVSHWRHFSWEVFRNNARHISFPYAVAAVSMTYLGLLLRAIRWRVFLQATKTIPVTHLIGPTLIGFTGLALLGRMGDLIRPYMIARKERLSLSSQLAILSIERIFDVGSLGALVAFFLVFFPELQSLPYLENFRKGILILVVLAALFGSMLFAFARRGQRVSVALERTLTAVSPPLAQRICPRLRLFSSELNIIRDLSTLCTLVALSLLIWLIAGMALLTTIHALPGTRQITLGGSFLLVAFGVLGSLVQLPGGGTQQLITIAALVKMFGLTAELAISCSILGWFTIFIAPVPAGLALLRHEGLRLGTLFRSSQQQAAVLTP